MKAHELMEKLYSLSVRKFDNTCDVLKAGDPDRELKKVAVCCITTVDVIKKAHEWGADLIITHEPIFYDHVEKKLENDIVTDLKTKLIEDTGMTIYRFHDFCHGAEPDMIAAGVIKYLGIEGKYETGGSFGVNNFTLKNPMSAREIALMFEKNLGVKHVRICGSTDKPCTKIKTCFGTPGGVFEALRSADTEIVLTGEACEWMLGEYARDADMLGLTKSLLIIGHMGSERDGMRYCADYLKENFTEFEVKYFDCKEVYSYTES